MGVIQQGINQGLALTAFGVSQNPAIKAKLEHAAEVKQSEKNIKQAHQTLNSIDDKIEQWTNNVDWDKPDNKLLKGQLKDIDNMQDIALKQANKSYEKAFELNPTQKNLENLYQNRKTINSLETLRENANKRAEETKQAKVGQKRDFREYLKKTQYSVGGHTGLIGDLPEKTQKLMASTYNQHQRQKLMNQMDKEKQNKENK